MSCERPYDLTAYAFGDRAPDAEDHVAECADCRAELESLGGLRERLGSLPEIEPSPDFVTRTRQAFLAATPEFKPAPAKTRAWRIVTSPRWSWGIAVHAAVFLIAAVYFVYHMPGEPPLDPVLDMPLKGEESPVAPEGTAEELMNAWDRALEKDPFRDLMSHRHIESVRRGNREAFGGAMTAEPVSAGVRWLASNQDENGSWSDDVQTTALATLALLAENGVKAPEIDPAVAYLKSNMRADGRVGDTIADHAVASAALVEVAVLDNDPNRRHVAEAAVAHLIAEQGADGTWGEATPWATQALRLSLMLDSRAAVPALATADAAETDAWTAIVASPVPAKPEPANAIPLDRKLTSLLFGSLAMYQLGGEPWTAWNTVAPSRLLTAAGDDGAWPADYDLEAARPDSARATALAVLTLQTYYRYPRFLP